MGILVDSDGAQEEQSVEAVDKDRIDVPCARNEVKASCVYRLGN